MILALVARLWTGFIALPRGWHYALAVAAVVIGLYAWHRDSVSDAVEADREATATAVASTAAVASERAVAASEGFRERGMDRNARAAAIASESADPLKAGLEGLRR